MLGLLVGAWANALIGQCHPARRPRHLLALPMNGRVFAAAFAASLLSGLLAGLVPAWLASRGDMVTTLKQQTRGSTSGRGPTGCATAWSWPRWRWPWPSSRPPAS